MDLLPPFSGPTAATRTGERGPVCAVYTIAADHSRLIEAIGCSKGAHEDVGQCLYKDMGTDTGQGVRVVLLGAASVCLKKGSTPAVLLICTSCSGEQLAAITSCFKNE